MVDLAAVLGVITDGLRLWAPQFTDIRLADVKAKQPSRYPYLTVKWIAPYVPDSRPPERRQAEVLSTMINPKTGKLWPTDIQYTYIRNPSATLSLSIYDEDRSRQVDALAVRCREWFDTPELGPAALNALGVRIREITNIRNQDAPIEGAYERRRGFDVILRLVDTTTWRVPTIETVELAQS